MNDKVKLLIIEDDEKIRSVLVTILEEANFDVYTSADGKTGIKLAESLLPQLIICDIMLPDIDGYEICERVREKKETAKCIFIFLTAKSEMEDLRKGMNCGADDYLTKPFKASDLLNAVYTRLEMHQKLLDKNEDENEDDNVELTLESNIFVNQKNVSKIIKVNSISAISAEGVYSTIYTADGGKYMLRKTLSNWEHALPSNIFIRIHRSYLVNQTQIEKIEPWFKHSFLVKIKNIDENFFISERYASKLRKQFSF
ncbi:MAG: response regulator [Melioribacteraceae bacterium]|nr:response regulator [Melioribacteraceae bacterium]MCF8356516.1 response regulator [Melioribacteraceae bacterium]MCF8396126.1 response regulator [Melioribacteraceae bacterium]MCF8420959.1 response regulator [Melioribacteraceae bacterium]